MIVFIAKELDGIDFEGFSQCLLDKVVENLRELGRPLTVKPAVDHSRVEIVPLLVHEPVPLDYRHACLSQGFEDGQATIRKPKCESHVIIFTSSNHPLKLRRHIF